MDEAIRYYNLDRTLYPSNPVELVDGDFGHQRAQNKPGDMALLKARIQAFFDHYVKGTGSTPSLGATAFVETCPSSAPSAGPYTASSWSALHPGEVDYSSAATQTVVSGAGDPTISHTIDPITGGGACATAPGADQGSGVATYRLPAATGAGYTLLGSPTVIANLNVTGQFAFIAARLWDVNTQTNTETLVARGVYRISQSKPNGTQVFQLHPGAWHFAAGHVAKLELLGADSPYLRTSNGTFSIAVSNLQLRLPVHETPGGPGVPPVVKKPKPPVKPNGGGCVARPQSRINHRRTHGSRKGISVAGSASEKACAHTSAGKRRRERVTHVYVIIYQHAAHGQCRFLEKNGRLTHTRSCQRPVRLRAKGTRSWSLKLNFKIPPGRYVIRSDAVDGLHHHQRASRASTAHVRVR